MSSRCLVLSCRSEPAEGQQHFCADHLRELRANPNGPWPGLSADFGVPRRRAQVALATGRRYTRREHRSSRPDTQTLSSVQGHERFLRMLLAEAEEHGVPAERVELLRRQMVEEAQSEDVAYYLARGGTVLDAEDEVLLLRLPDAIDELVAEAESDHDIRTEEEVTS